MDTIMKGEMEVSRLLKLKAEMRGKLIEEARETIVQLWEETNASQATRFTFKGLDCTDEASYTDELLQEHDEEIEVLRARLETMRPMLKMIERREEVVEERLKYEELQKDPDRLKQVRSCELRRDKTPLSILMLQNPPPSLLARSSSFTPCSARHSAAVLSRSSSCWRRRCRSASRRTYRSTTRLSASGLRSGKLSLGSTLCTKGRLTPRRWRGRSPSGLRTRTR